MFNHDGASPSHTALVCDSDALNFTSVDHLLELTVGNRLDLLALDPPLLNGQNDGDQPLIRVFLSTALLAGYFRKCAKIGANCGCFR